MEALKMKKNSHKAFAEIIYPRRYRDHFAEVIRMQSSIYKKKM
jgi:hypothetical protein